MWRFFIPHFSHTNSQNSFKIIIFLCTHLCISLLLLCVSEPLRRVLLLMGLSELAKPEIHQFLEGQGQSLAGLNTLKKTSKKHEKIVLRNSCCLSYQATKLLRVLPPSFFCLFTQKNVSNFSKLLEFVDREAFFRKAFAQRAGKRQVRVRLGLTF